MIVMNDIDGYVLYTRKRSRYSSIPIGIVSDNGEYNAKCNLDQLPEYLIKYLITIEDKRYFKHGSYDVKALIRAICINILRKRWSQGGSTLTQQLARNLMRVNTKNLYRKLVEMSYAHKIERQFSKEQILYLYVNHVFWGKNCYGIRSASICFFGKEPSRLSKAQALLLIAILKGPNYYLTDINALIQRYNVASDCLYKNAVISEREQNRQISRLPNIEHLEPLLYRTRGIEYITNSIDDINKRIFTTIEQSMQSLIDSYRPNDMLLSLVVIKKKQVIGLHSPYGSDYIFDYKCNVGSTLKPFVYSCLIDNGFKSTDCFSTTFKGIPNYNINEVVRPNKELMSLEDALFNSNNNVFLSASYALGIDHVLGFLSRVLCIDTECLTPSSILGATTCGISLYNLAQAYYRFFIKKNLSESEKDTIVVMKKIASGKLGLGHTNIFMKTGTTNSYKEQFVLLGYKDLLFAFLTHDTNHILNNKQGALLSYVRDFILMLARKKYEYKYE